jgi:hypothetical protein
MSEIEEALSLDYNLIFLWEHRNSPIMQIFTSTMKRMGKSSATPLFLHMPVATSR